jgi:hypothetical protein
LVRVYVDDADPAARAAALKKAREFVARVASRPAPSERDDRARRAAALRRLRFVRAHADLRGCARAEFLDALPAEEHVAWRKLFEAVEAAAAPLADGFREELGEAFVDGP